MVNYVRLTPGIAIPEYMRFLPELRKPVKYTGKAVEAGHLPLIDYHPPYIQLECRDLDRVVEEARRKGLRVYMDKRWSLQG
jgi:hypothetical protein